MLIFFPVYSYKSPCTLVTEDPSSELIRACCLRVFWILQLVLQGAKGNHNHIISSTSRCDLYNTSKNQAPPGQQFCVHILAQRENTVISQLYICTKLNLMPEQEKLQLQLCSHVHTKRYMLFLQIKCAIIKKKFLWRWYF